MRCIFIDESYDSTDGPGGNRFFVLAALKAENIEVLSSAIKGVRKKIREYNHNCRGKRKSCSGKFMSMRYIVNTL